MKKGKKYLFRFITIFILQIIMKAFDHSFNGVFDLSLRWFFFFTAFTLYWMLVWEGATLCLNSLESFYKRKRKTLNVVFILTSFIILYLASTNILFDILFRFWDTRLFAMDDVWKTVPFPHPDMVYPLFLISFLIFVGDRFNRFKVLVNRAEFVSSKLKQENIQANYEALKNQVDPHFLFNSLSVLSSMVHTQPDLASKYIYNLSKLYRYILESKKSNLVFLYQELDFLDSYIFLMKIRHKETIKFSIKLDEMTRQRTGIHPISLQLLVENALKHNSFKQEEPLYVDIYEEKEFICVSNTLRKKKLLSPTTKVGLENIKNRYMLHDCKEVEIIEDDEKFIVKLPKIIMR
ncbi:MAG: histidine kinase [Prolixibacteraceae bacterium]|nr:histidine kinase [Prolixibacteraceae bacterium]